MKNFDLNALGVTEMTQKNLIEVNGGNDIDVGLALKALGGVLGTVVQAAWIFFTQIVPIFEQQVCERASKDDYVIWADLGHR
jgi:hypothetical protein